jgi:hypothetical protein
MIHFLRLGSSFPSPLANTASQPARSNAPRRHGLLFSAVFIALLLIAGITNARAQEVKVEKCSTGILPAGDMNTDLLIDNTTCTVDGSVSSGGQNGIYVYRNVNIINHGTLTFDDKPIDFHAHSILVELNGTLSAGATSPIKGPLTFWLWGAQGDGIANITCKSDNVNQCGVPKSIWDSNPKMNMPTSPCIPAKFDGKPVLPNDDCFYAYEGLDANAKAGEYFGPKVMAVSAGGSLMLRGSKGIRQGAIEANPADSGTSWGRLTKTLNGGESSLYIDRAVSTWAKGDHIVVTTTDYLPGHTEELVIKDVTKDSTGTRIDIDVSKTIIRYPHYGETYDYSGIVATHEAAKLPPVGPALDPNLPYLHLKPNNIETRAIVALLTRSIVIASEGDTPIVERTAIHFPTVPGSYYGGHTLVRQGFANYQVQGVEFFQLGQGGIIGHYPVHFHMARSVPQPDVATNYLGTYVADCSVVDSMTRFITVHATQGVTLARNVGYKSIGHGFYLEDATEIKNRLYSNVGISVEGALANIATNPRLVPGILDLAPEKLPWPASVPPHAILKPGDQVPDFPPYTTDITTPSTYWIMNTWNDFEYNAAVGVGVCGACYWLPPGGVSGPSQNEWWTGYASMQKLDTLYGAVPMMEFKGNSCSAAMGGIITVGQTNQCNGVFYGPGTSTDTKFVSVPNPNSVDYTAYPVEGGGQRKNATVCNTPDGDCSTVTPCSGTGSALANCTATVFDHFTTSFNWAPTNFAAIWLRGWWFLVENSAITDVQNGGLTFITGGGYSRSDASQGYWSVLKNSILVGNTQPIINKYLPVNPSASNGGPFNPKGLNCPYNTSQCISPADGIVFVGSNFAVNQRLFNIYDGPATEFSNIYADVHQTVLGTLAQCRPDGNTVAGECHQQWMNGFYPGVLQSPPGNKTTNNCVLPNAAIAWKQPNGFYYPPAFGSYNLVFQDVDIRHFVIQPAYKPGTLTTDLDLIKNTYCSWQNAMFADSFTDIDRETELTDEDGSLTGLTSNITLNDPQPAPTISVTKDTYFNAPLITDECSSGQPDPYTQKGKGATVDTSPYEYLTTALVAECARRNPDKHDCAGNWLNECTNPRCYGVPLYRQSITQAEMTAKSTPSISMMGQASAQRSSLTLNHASYYIDTSLSLAGQQAITYPEPPPDRQRYGFWSVFQPDQTYDIFFLFATEDTKQTYSIYIGAGLTETEAKATLANGRMPIPDNSFPWEPDTSGSWATFGGYDSNSGVLTVKVSLAGLTDLDPANRSDFCQPANYCAWNASTKACGCAAGTACETEKNDAVCAVAVKELDCPVNGCYGFSITMPSSFTTFMTPKPPPPTQLYATTEPSYFAKDKVIFVDPGDSVSGTQCHYEPVPVQDDKPKTAVVMQNSPAE